MSHNVKIVRSGALSVNLGKIGTVELGVLGEADRGETIPAEEVLERLALRHG